MEKILKFTITGLLLLLISSCSTIADVVLEPIKVKVPDVSVKDLDLKTATLAVTLKVTNPNAVSATAEKLTYDLSVGGKNVAKGVYEKDVKVAGNDSTEVTVPITVTNKDILVFLTKVITKGETPYHAVGEVKVGPVNIPFDEKGTIKSSDL